VNSRVNVTPMENRYWRKICLLGLLASFSAFGGDVPFDAKTKVSFSTPEDSARKLTQVDSFIENLSRFDRAARLKTDKDVSQEEFLRFVAKQTLAWDEAEKTKLIAVMKAVSERVAPYHLHLPAVVFLVKTTGAEEGHAGYCRSNCIVLPQNLVARSAADLEISFTHELFHILSRNNPKLRDSLYSIIGFEPCSEIEFPDVLKPRKITNPDAPRNNYVMKVALKGEPLPVVPILLSSSERYDLAKGGEFFSYLVFKLLVLEEVNKKWQPKLFDGKPRLLDVSETPDFFKKIGRNTDYIIHPEEILAENFVLLIDGKKTPPTPEIIAEMKRRLLENKP
jgi:hypothetical protein